MCISNIGNRRRYNAALTSMKKQQNTSFFNQIKDELQTIVAPKSPTSTIDTHPAELALAKQACKKVHITVQHNYHDHVNDSPTNYKEEHPARGGVTIPFPIKLHEMLDSIERDGLEEIISWQPHGRCFLVHKPKEFVKILPKYFKLSKLASFQRQLNLYGFQRLTKGQDRGGYYHELFLRDREYLAHSIQRIKVKGTGVRARSNPEQEPNFWSMPWVTKNSNNTVNDQVISYSKRILADLPLHLATPAPYTSSYDIPKAPQTNELYSCSSMQALPTDSDFVLDAFSKPFHYLDPFNASTEEQTSSTSVMDDLLTTEAEAFFDDFEFPEDMGFEIEDDEVLGNLLEQMIA